MSGDKEKKPYKRTDGQPPKLTAVKVAEGAMLQRRYRLAWKGAQHMVHVGPQGKNQKRPSGRWEAPRAAHHDGQHDHGAAGQLVLEGGAPGHALHVGDVPAGRKMGADAAAGGMLCRHCSTNFEASCLTRCQTYVPSASTPRRSRLKSSHLPEHRPRCCRLSQPGARRQPGPSLAHRQRQKSSLRTPGSPWSPPTLMMAADWLRSRR